MAICSKFYRKLSHSRRQGGNSIKAFALLRQPRSRQHLGASESNGFSSGCQTGVSLSYRDWRRRYRPEAESNSFVLAPWSFRESPVDFNRILPTGFHSAVARRKHVAGFGEEIRGNLAPARGKENREAAICLGVCLFTHMVKIIQCHKTSRATCMRFRRFILRESLRSHRDLDLRSCSHMLRSITGTLVRAFQTPSLSPRPAHRR